MRDFRFSWQRVFCNVALCSQVDFDRRFRGAYLLHHQGAIIAMMMETVRSSETSVKINLTTRRYISCIVRFDFRPAGGDTLRLSPLDAAGLAIVYQCV
jgi:hypothetical protein